MLKGWAAFLLYFQFDFMFISMEDRVHQISRWTPPSPHQMASVSICLVLRFQTLARFPSQSRHLPKYNPFLPYSSLVGGTLRWECPGHSKSGGWHRWCGCSRRGTWNHGLNLIVHGYFLWSCLEYVVHDEDFMQKEDKDKIVPVIL